MSKGKPIYVEILIQSSLEKLWKHTQAPALHQQWDLRFSEITFLPKMNEGEPQRFLYQTNIGFGLRISGEGESAGTQENDGVLTSSLKFSSGHLFSLISEGAGYWRYVPTEKGIRFFTRYDYRTRFGLIGVWLDLLIFRPLIGWATAWSFDTLRLWLEKGISPQHSIRRSLIDLISMIGLFIIWVYQGLFPKLLFPDSGEMELLRGIGFLQGYERTVLTLMGLGEIGFGFLFVLLGKRYRKALHTWSILLLIILGVGAVGRPEVYVEPFNPISLNFAMIALSVINLLNASELPDVNNCLRYPGSPRPVRKG